VSTRTPFSDNISTFIQPFDSLNVFIYLIFRLKNGPRVPQIAKARTTVSPLVYFFPFDGRHVPAKIAHIT